MSYGELKTDFEGLLKRRDLTPTQSAAFLRQGINRAQRVLRIPPMEKSILVTYDGQTFTNGQIPIPGDYLKLIGITANDSIALTSADLQTVLDLAQFTGEPTRYIRRGSMWKFGKTPDAGTVFRVDYYNEFSELSDDNDSNYLTGGARDLAVYYALGYAGDHFIDRRTESWKATAEAIRDEIQDQADQDTLVNAAVAPGFCYPED